MGFLHRRQGRTTQALDMGRIARPGPGTGDSRYPLCDQVVQAGHALARRLCPDVARAGQVP